MAMIETADLEWVITRSGTDGTRVMQFLVNTVIFALTREGSLTQQGMDTVSY